MKKKKKHTSKKKLSFKIFSFNFYFKHVLHRHNVALWKFYLAYQCHVSYYIKYFHGICFVYVLEENHKIFFKKVLKKGDNFHNMF